MRLITLCGLMTVVAMLVLPTTVWAQCTGTCWITFTMHRVPYETGPFANMQFNHDELTTPANCNGHECGTEDEDAALDAETIEAIEELYRGGVVPVPMLRAIAARSARVVFNVDRGALQVYSCDNTHIIAHLPLRSEVIRALLEAD